MAGPVIGPEALGEGSTRLSAVPNGCADRAACFLGASRLGWPGVRPRASVRRHAILFIILLRLWLERVFAGSYRSRMSRFVGLLSVLLLASSAAFAGAEAVLLVKVLKDDDKLIVQRRNGERWMITKGVGAISVYRYEGRQVVISSPGIFCGVGSTLILVDDGQEARIWDAEAIGSGGVSPSVPLPSVPVPSVAADKVSAALTLIGLHQPGANPLTALYKYQALRKLPVEPKFTPTLFLALAKDLLALRPVTPFNAALAQSLAADASGAAPGGSPVRVPVVLPSADIIESNVSGAFEGWKGETIFKLMNGEIWQQVEYHYEYHYAYSPRVLIIPSAGGYKAKVEGLSKAVGVTRLR